MVLLYFWPQYTFPSIFLSVPTGTDQCCFLHYPTHTLNNADLTLTMSVLFVSFLICCSVHTAPALCNHTIVAKNREAQLVPCSIRRRRKTDDHSHASAGKFILQKPHCVEAAWNMWVSGECMLRLWAGYQLVGAFRIFELEAGKQPWFTFFVSQNQLSD